jgi:hypothetical protein
MTGWLIKVQVAMKLRYQNDIEDYVAFARFFYAQAPILKQQALRTSLLYFFLIAGAASVTPLPIRPLFRLAFALPFAGAIAVGIYAAWTPLMIWLCGRNTRKIYQQQPDKTIGADIELEILNAELHDRNTYCESHWQLAAVEEIVETRDHVFLRISPTRAYILPRDRLDPDALEEFLDDLERALGGHERPLPAPASSEAIQADRRRPWQRM